MISTRVGLTTLILGSMLTLDSFSALPVVEPPPSGTELVELAPPPDTEPPPSCSDLVELAPPPQVEPGPAGDALVLLGLPPRTEPAPSGRELLVLGPAPAMEPPPSWPRLVDPEELAAEDAGLAKLLQSHEIAFSPRHRHYHEPDRGPGPGEGEFPCGPASGDAPAGPPFSVRGHLFTATWIERTLHGIIANECHSKTYTDILALDGGTVGICHFASGSLRTLYRQMDLPRYFGEHADHIPDRPYGLDWWRDGMRRFFSSHEARGAEQRAWRAFISPALGFAVDHGWSSDRELAIAASVANSLGAYGFSRLAAQCGWRPERTLISYARLSAHKERRRQRLNNKFPLGEDAVASVGPNP